MKKVYMIYILFCVLFFSSCSKESSSIHEIEYNGIIAQVDKAARTISTNGQIYQYELNGNKTTIYYPNGANYWWVSSENMGQGGYSDNYDTETYVDGMDLIEIIERTTENKIFQGNPLLAIILIIMGVFNTAAPSLSWYIGYGWRFKNAEPSDSVLVLNRIVGIVLIFAGVLSFFISF